MLSKKLLTTLLIGLVSTPSFANPNCTEEYMQDRSYFDGVTQPDLEHFRHETIDNLFDNVFLKKPKQPGNIIDKTRCNWNNELDLKSGCYNPNRKQCNPNEYYCHLAYIDAKLVPVGYVLGPTDQAITVEKCNEQGLLCVCNYQQEIR